MQMRLTEVFSKSYDKLYKTGCQISLPKGPTIHLNLRCDETAIRLP